MLDLEEQILREWVGALVGQRPDAVCERAVVDRVQPARGVERDELPPPDWSLNQDL